MNNSRIVILILIYHRHKPTDLKILNTESDTESIIKVSNKHELCLSFELQTQVRYATTNTADPWNKNIPEKASSRNSSISDVFHLS
jgi:hypothetical protein